MLNLTTLIKGLHYWIIWGWEGSGKWRGRREIKGQSLYLQNYHENNKVVILKINFTPLGEKGQTCKANIFWALIILKFIL